MKVTGNSQEITRYLQQASQSRTRGIGESEAAEAAAGPKPAPGRDVVVEISVASKEMQLAREAIAALPSERTEKVEPLKEKFRADLYTMDVEKTAEKLVQSFIDEFA